jgi:hypothetical protein
MIPDPANRPIQPNEPLAEIGKVYNDSTTPVTAERLAKILTWVANWRAALAQGDQVKENTARQMFMALTVCLERGRHFKDDGPVLSDNLPLGRPQLEEAVWHLWQIAHRPGTTDREKGEALDAVLKEAASIGQAPVDTRSEGKPDAKFVPLTSWNEIITALNEPHGKTVWKNDDQTRDKIKKLNVEFDGPIVMPEGRGTQPRVSKDELLKWMSGLREQFDNRTAEADQDSTSRKMIDARLNWPPGRASRLARRSQIPHYVLPDGAIRIRWDEIQPLVRHVSLPLEQEAAPCK